MLTNISLGTYDKRFLNNITNMYLSSNKPVTTNQANLLDKIIARYSRQLSKKELSVEEAHGLEWKIQPIASIPEFTEAKISIEDDVVFLRSPYKADFVKEFKGQPFVKWNPLTKHWSAPLCEVVLKNIVESTVGHYKTVNFCEESKAILAEIDSYKDMRWWTPTLIYTNDRLIIAAVNKHIHESIETIDIALTLGSVSRLIRYGIDIDDSVKNILCKTYDPDKVEFACNRTHKIEAEVPLVVDYIKAIETDCVVFYEWNSANSEFASDLKVKLKSEGINCSIIDRRSIGNDIVSIMDNAKMPVTLTNWSNSITPISGYPVKTIQLVNSKPIRLE